MDQYGFPVQLTVRPTDAGVTVTVRRASSEESVVGDDLASVVRIVLARLGDAPAIVAWTTSDKPLATRLSRLIESHS
jgi:hypothetical protein